jgi:hypothetical protein
LKPPTQPPMVGLTIDERPARNELPVRGRLTRGLLGRSLLAAGLPRPLGERLDLLTTNMVRTERTGAAQEAIRTWTSTKSSLSDSDDEDVGRTGEGYRAQVPMPESVLSLAGT